MFIKLSMERQKNMSSLSKIFHLQEITYSIPSAMWQLHHYDHHSLLVVMSGHGELICDHENIHLIERKAYTRAKPSFLIR